jgi:hypothetical protein
VIPDLSNNRNIYTEQTEHPPVQNRECFKFLGNYPGKAAGICFVIFSIKIPFQRIKALGSTAKIDWAVIESMSRKSRQLEKFETVFSKNVNFWLLFTLEILNIYFSGNFSIWLVVYEFFAPYHLIKVLKILCFWVNFRFSWLIWCSGVMIMVQTWKICQEASILIFCGVSLLIY